MQLTNMSFSSYLEEFIIKPANLSSMFYFIGGPGMEPRGMRKHVVTIPSYVTSFTSASGSGSEAHTACCGGEETVLFMPSECA